MKEPLFHSNQFWHTVDEAFPILIAAFFQNCFGLSTLHGNNFLHEASTYLFWFCHQNALQSCQTLLQSLKIILNFIFHYKRAATRRRYCTKIEEQTLKPMISPLLKHFQGWYGYQKKQNTSRNLNFLSFCARIELDFDKLQKTSENHTILSSILTFL